MKTSNLKPRLLSLAGLAAWGVTGCVDGNLSHRNDSQVATDMRYRTVSPSYEASLAKETARVRQDYPDLSDREAFQKALNSIGPAYTSSVGLTRRERETKSAQATFEAELAELDRP